MLGVTVKNLIESYESMHINILLTDTIIEQNDTIYETFNKDLQKLSFDFDINVTSKSLSFFIYK